MPNYPKYQCLIDHLGRELRECKLCKREAGLSTEDICDACYINNNKKTLTDAELIALSSLAQVEAVLMAGDNIACVANSKLPNWRVNALGLPLMPASGKLREELIKRGILK